MPSPQTSQPKRPPKIQLPFDQGPKDPGAWAYDHRIALCVTVIVYLLAGIAFMTVKIIVGTPQRTEAFYVDLVPEPPVSPLPEEKQQIDRIDRSDDFSQISNRISNENAGAGEGSSGLNARVRDDRGTQAQAIYDEADAVQERTRANRRAYEEGLGQERAISEGRPRSSSGASSSGGDSRAAGKVTVSFSLSNPLRYSADLVIPAYRCRGGGELIVTITVNRNGDVTAAKVTRASSSVDECMTSTALEAAHGSRFNVDPKAPDKQQGTITYVFIPQ